ncbi:ThuA domain-containing protein [Lewinella sp. JB7]|uniref:ThuA domain-containing protein n=1 Tax=Lewinella sp. JB7 TaxID=2962887 RepID=UPI0020C9C1A2|nr:ThuA domain-containing protein [Lewinella sp. JB7]MCP9236132.1 ThuA domain-containing protein [Lewinella sp. JB7]
MHQYYIFLLLLGGLGSLAAQPLVSAFHVSAGEYDRQDTPVCVAVADSLWNNRGELGLYETTTGENRAIAAQWTDGQLCWVMTGATPAGTTRRYRLAPASGTSMAPAFTASKDEGAVRFAVNGRDVLTYQQAPAGVPAGVDPIFSRGGYLHPLLSPAGDTLTRIQPPDHYHHYGVWNPWTHTEFRGRELDFWNLVRGHGTVATQDVTGVHEGSVTAGLTARHAYLAYRDSAVTDNPEQLLEETLNLRVLPAHGDNYQIDYTTEQTNITGEPFTVKAYRYQGFGYRGRAGWNDDNVDLLTSAGRNKADGNATRARWMKVEGPTEHGRAGILFMTHPGNYNYPEQIRIWPTGANGGKENVFVNFNPAQDRDYVMRPGGTYRLRYRMMVYDGQLDTTTANRYWRDFAHPPRVTWEADDGLRGARVLLYTKNGEGFVHDNIPASIAAIRKLGEENGFEVVHTEDPGMFTPDRLEEYDVLVFSNTNNDIFDTPEQEAAFRSYIEAGGGFVGIHSACGSERDWPWFWRNVGGKFFRHARRQDFDVAVVDADHPSTDFLPPTWHIRDDECYYLKQLNPAIHVLLAADLGTVDDEEGHATYPADTFGSSFPTSWYHTTDGGRQWYTSLGHRIEHYSDPQFLRHILGGIRWAAE